MPILLICYSHAYVDQPMLFYYLQQGTHFWYQQPCFHDTKSSLQFHVSIYLFLENFVGSFQHAFLHIKNLTLLSASCRWILGIYMYRFELLLIDLPCSSVPGSPESLSASVRQESFSGVQNRTVSLSVIYRLPATYLCGADVEHPYLQVPLQGIQLVNIHVLICPVSINVPAMVFILSRSNLRAIEVPAIDFLFNNQQFCLVGGRWSSTKCKSKSRFLSLCCLQTSLCCFEMIL